ncbi:MAG: hypothetical protein ABSA08_00745 [Acidimicrobiales bacterium]
MLISADLRRSADIPLTRDAKGSATIAERSGYKGGAMPERGWDDVRKLITARIADGSFTSDAAVDLMLRVVEDPRVNLTDEQRRTAYRLIADKIPDITAILGEMGFDDQP